MVGTSNQSVPEMAIDRRGVNLVAHIQPAEPVSLAATRWCVSDMFVGHPQTPFVYSYHHHKPHT